MVYGTHNFTVIKKEIKSGKKVFNKKYCNVGMTWHQRRNKCRRILLTQARNKENGSAFIQDVWNFYGSLHNNQIHIEEKHIYATGI